MVFILTSVSRYLTPPVVVVARPMVTPALKGTRERDELMIWVKQIVDRGEVRLWPAACGFYPSPHDLHILLRHRLLLQADGFEGLSLRSEPFHANDGSISQGPDACPSLLERRAAAAASTKGPVVA